MSSSKNSKPSTFQRTRRIQYDPVKSTTSNLNTLNPVKKATDLQRNRYQRRSAATDGIPSADTRPGSSCCPVPEPGGWFSSTTETFCSWEPACRARTAGRRLAILAAPRCLRRSAPRSTRRWVPSAAAAKRAAAKIRPSSRTCPDIFRSWPDRWATTPTAPARSRRGWCYSARAWRFQRGTHQHLFNISLFTPSKLDWRSIIQVG